MGHPLTLVGFMEMYPTQDACQQALFERVTPVRYTSSAAASVGAR